MLWLSEVGVQLIYIFGQEIRNEDVGLGIGTVQCTFYWDRDIKCTCDLSK